MHAGKSLSFPLFYCNSSVEGCRDSVGTTHGCRHIHGKLWFRQCAVFLWLASCHANYEELYRQPHIHDVSTTRQQQQQQPLVVVGLSEGGVFSFARFRR